MTKPLSSPRLPKQHALGSRVGLRSDAVLRSSTNTSAIGHHQPPRDHHDTYQLYRRKERVLEAVLDSSHDGSDGSSPSGNQSPDVDDVTRRAALMAVATGAAAVWWLSCFPTEKADPRAIQQITAQVTFADARASCVDAASMTSTLYSQMSSTLRMARSNYMDLDLFQATCKRRLGSPYICESFAALQDALPVVGYELAYSPDMSGVGWVFAMLGQPRLDTARKEQFEALTLVALQRCRRLQRMLKTMAAGEYTPAAVEMMLVDLKQLSKVLDAMLLEVPKRVPSEQL